MSAVWFDATVKKVFDRAALVELDDGEQVMIPLSQIRQQVGSLEDGEDVTLSIPQWLADDREIETYRFKK